MVRNINYVHTEMTAAFGVGDGGDALDDQRDLVLRLEAFDVASVQRRLKIQTILVAAPNVAEALRIIGLATAVISYIVGNKESDVAIIDRPSRVVIDERIIAAHVELENLPPRPRSRALLQARQRHRTD